jgi:hypothetical protein
MEFEFDNMTKLESKLSVSVYGPAGSGKTTSAFKLAMGIRDQLYPGKSLKDIGLFIDTERKSSSKSVGRNVGGEALEAMEVYHFEAPFDIYKYAQLVEYAVSKGKKIIITDSFTPFWSGTSGILENVAELEVSLAGAKKAYGAWSEKAIIAKKNLLKSVVSNSNAHMIFCYRAKTEYDISKNDKGRTVINVVGVKEDMQGDVPYEHDIVFSVNRETHGISIIKDRLGFMEYRMTRTDSEGPIVISDGKELAKIVSEGISLEEVTARKKSKLIHFILDEKAHKSSKVSLLEKAKNLELTESLLTGMDYEVLTKIVEMIK